MPVLRSAPMTPDTHAAASSPSDDGESEALRDLSREMYWARETAARARMDTPEIRDRLHDFASQMRTDETRRDPDGGGQPRVAFEMAPAAQAPHLARDAPGDLALRPAARRPRRAHHRASPRRSWCSRPRSDRLRGRARRAPGASEGRGPAPADRVRPRRRGDAHRGPRQRACARPVTRPTSCRSPASGTRRASSPTRWRCGAASTSPSSNGLKVDAVIGLKFPAYLAQHERKIVWLIHQHRTAYELWDHPDYADLEAPGRRRGRARHGLGSRPRRPGRGQARLHEREERARPALEHRCASPRSRCTTRAMSPRSCSTRRPARSATTSLFPSRMESLKRQSLAIDAMSTSRPACGSCSWAAAPMRPSCASRSSDSASASAGRVRDRRERRAPAQLYREALGVYFGPFDEDYGYVTIEGFAAVAPGRHR